MSQASKDILSKCFFSAMAVSLTFGAAQYALGRDLAGAGLIASQKSSAASGFINRAAKTDRAGAMGAADQTQTIALRFDSLPATSVLVRMPAASVSRSVPAPFPTKPGNRMAVACEPVVSVLTDIARQLQPGRCVT